MKVLAKVLCLSALSVHLRGGAGKAIDSGANLFAAEFERKIDERLGVDARRKDTFVF